MIKDNIINKGGNNSKVVGVIVDAKTAKFKSKKLVKFFLVKSQLFAKSFRLGFLTLRARLTFTKLR